MFHRFLFVLVAAVAAAILASTALAARVTIRVEGRTQTLFAPAPRIVDATTPLEALELASQAGEFYYHVSQTSFGPYVDHVGRYKAEGQTGWVFKVNGASPPVGADQHRLRDVDAVLWYWAQFGVAGGPPTLVLERRPRNCYQVLRQDDRGVATPAAGAVLHVDGRTPATRNGRACVGRHRGLVRATLEGAVRSNAVR